MAAANPAVYMVGEMLKTRPLAFALSPHKVPHAGMNPFATQQQVRVPPALLIVAVWLARRRR